MSEDTIGVIKLVVWVIVIGVLLYLEEHVVIRSLETKEVKKRREDIESGKINKDGSFTEGYLLSLRVQEKKKIDDRFTSFFRDRSSIRRRNGKADVLRRQ